MNKKYNFVSSRVAIFLHVVLSLRRFSSFTVHQTNSCKSSKEPSAQSRTACLGQMRQKTRIVGRYALHSNLLQRLYWNSMPLLTISYHFQYPWHFANQGEHLFIRSPLSIFLRWNNTVRLGPVPVYCRCKTIKHEAWTIVATRTVAPGVYGQIGLALPLCISYAYWALKIRGIFLTLTPVASHLLRGHQHRDLWSQAAQTNFRPRATAPLLRNPEKKNSVEEPHQNWVTRVTRPYPLEAAQHPEQ